MFEKFPGAQFPKFFKAAINQFVNWPSLPTGNPSNSRHAASKGYVDAQIAAIPAAIFTKSYDSGEQAITLAGALTLAHSMTIKPKLVALIFINKTTELNYSVGDEVYFTGGDANQSGTVIGVVIDATNITIRYPATQIIVPNKTTGASSTQITPANWKLIVRAYA